MDSVDQSAVRGHTVPGRQMMRSTVGKRTRVGPSAPDITVVVLDLGGVVVPTLFEIINEPAMPRGPFGRDDRYDDVEDGLIQERDYWAELSRARPDLDIRAVVRESMHVRPEVLTLLDKLDGRIRVAGLTNDMAHWFGPSWAVRFSAFKRFDVLLDAARSGHLKPDLLVFRWAVGELRVPAEACLFVDDIPANLRAAANTGMQTEHFDVTDPFGSVQRILETLGF